MLAVTDASPRSWPPRADLAFAVRVETRLFARSIDVNFSIYLPIPITANRFMLPLHHKHSEAHVLAQSKIEASCATLPRTGRALNQLEVQAEQFLPATQVCERYSRSDMSIHRWLQDPNMGFPKPLYFGRFRYWKLSELVEWERERAAARNPV